MAALAVPALGTAATLYTQPYAETANGGYFASTPASYLQYDSFVLPTNGRIESISWWGVDLNELIPVTPINPTSFTLAIHADAGGAPGALLSFTTVGNSGNEVDTGSLLMGLHLYSFSGTLSTPFVATAGTKYWLGISDPTTNADWFWVSGSGPDGVHTGIVGGTTSSYADDMSFVISGTPVPEPASAALFLMGAAGLAGVLRRKVR